MLRDECVRCGCELKLDKGQKPLCEDCLKVPNAGANVPYLENQRLHAALAEFGASAEDRRLLGAGMLRVERVDPLQTGAPERNYSEQVTGHLTFVLTQMLGTDFATIYPPDANPERVGAALAHRRYAYEIWACWAIMTATH